MAVLRYFHQDPKQTSVQESSIVDKLGTALTLKLTNINQSISNNTLAIDDKLNSIPGKSLSTNDFTDEYKNKLRGIEEGAEVNVQSDWGEGDNTADSYIKNKPTSLPASDVYDWAKQPNKPSYNLDEVPDGNIRKLSNYIPLAQKGIYGGVATLGANDGKVPESQLPSYVDDVLEYINNSQFPVIGESGKIYVNTTTNLTYRWTGTLYTEISPSIALGETSSTAYAGDKGKALADSLSSLTGIVNDTQDYQDILDWNTRVAIAKINGTEITAKLPSNPDTWRPISDSINTVSSTISASLTAVKAAYDLAASKTSNTGTVTSVGLTVPTGLSVSGSPITTKGTLAITLTKGYSIPTTAKLDEWDAKQNAISDLSTIRTNASNGNTAYGWGNHANAGYLAAISDLATIRSNASEGHTAYGWGNHANAGYVKSSGVTSVAMTVPTGLAISGSPITSTGTLALSFANGYSIPTTAKLGNWDTAYGWGNHANAGYVKSSGVTKISTTDGVVGGDITTTGTIKANLASYTKNVSDIGGKLYAVQLDKSGRLAVNVPWTNTWKVANSSQEGYVPKSTANKILRANGDGALYWGDDANTWTAWKGATSSANGTAGYMPAPTKDQYHLFLRGDGTWVSLNNYSLPLAASGTRGGVLIGFTTDAANRNYAVLLSGEKMYVNVPWTDNNTTYSAGSGLSLSGTTFSLALTKNLVTTALGYTPPTQDTNTWRGITDSYSGTDSSISLSQKGGNALYNALLNGYASSAGNADTVDGYHYNNLPYLPISGGTTTGNINFKAGHDLKLSNNGVSRTLYHTTFNIIDKNGYISARLENIISSNGSNGFYLYARLYNSSGSLTLQKGILYAIAKDGTGTWNINDAASFRTALQLGARATDNTDYIPLSYYTNIMNANASGNAFTDTAGWHIITVSDSTVDGNFSSSKYGSCIQWSNNPNQKPSVVNQRNWYNQLFGLIDDRLYFRTRSNGGNWTPLKTIAYTYEIPTNLNQLTNGPGYITGITKAMVTTALGYTPPTQDTNTHRPILVNGTEVLGNNTTALNLKAGSNVTLSNSGGTVTIAATNTNNAVTLTNTTTDAFYRLLFSGTADDTNHTEGARKNTNIKVNPNHGGIYAKGFFHTGASFSDTWTDSYNKNHPWYGIDFRAESGSNYFHSVYSDYFGMCFRTCFIKIAIGDYSAGAAELARTIYINNARDTNPIIFSVAGTINAENRLLAPNTYTTHIDGRGSDEGGEGPLYILCIEDEPVVIASGGQVVGIGKYPTLGNVDINGVCHASQFMPNSDLRLKDILSNMSINLKDVAEAPVFLFKWKDKNIDNFVHVGTSAQYWKEKVPELVSEANDDIKTLSLDYSALSVASNVTLAKEVVSLKEEIKLLQALIAELKLLLNN